MGTFPCWVSTHVPFAWLRTLYQKIARETEKQCTQPEAVILLYAGEGNQVLWGTGRKPSQEVQEKQGFTKAEEHRPPWVAIIRLPVSSAAQKGLRPAVSLASPSSLPLSSLPYVLVTLLESGIYQPPALPNSDPLLTPELFPFCLSLNLPSSSPSSHPLSSCFP